MSSVFPSFSVGALDVGATGINEQMKMACVKALAAMAQEEVSDEVALAYPGQELVFGRDYLIPKPFDPSLITIIAPAVALAAMNSGVATRPIADMEAYREKLREFVYQSGVGMRAVFSAAKRSSETRIVYCDGEDERMLRAAQTIINEGSDAADPDRSPRGHCDSPEEDLVEVAPGYRFRGGRPGQRRALQGVLDCLSPVAQAPRGDRRHRQDALAHQQHHHRGHAA
jgi:hypothetical protein